MVFKSFGYLVYFSFISDENSSEEDSKFALSFNNNPFVIFYSMNLHNPAYFSYLSLSLSFTCFNA